MKTTRELIDNGKKIIHLNYTKKERRRREAEAMKKIEEARKAAEERMKKEQEVKEAE